MLRFGTDGVRGRANSELTPELVLALGRAAARILGRAAGPRESPRFFVGRDTRISGPVLQAALSAGLAAEGADVLDLGVLPTPAVAYLSAAGGVPAAMISASHNPFWDNGVKFFSAGGTKLADEVEEALEAELDALLARGHGTGGSTPVGRLEVDHDAMARYEGHLLAALDGRALQGLRVALDCAHGAAFDCAPEMFRQAGAEVVALIGADPDGTNINDRCGSTAPEQLARAVAAGRADLGLAFDGDADRVIAVDHDGNVVDGDRLLALFATDLAERGLLSGGTVVVTVMTNLGFHHAMAQAGIRAHTTAVGDRYVLEALEANQWVLGGEQSGHIIFRSLATTGDGVLAGLLLSDLLCRRGAPLAQLAAGALERLPQVLVNVRVRDRHGLEAAEAVWEEVKRAEAELGDGGRVLLRPSGTEPLVRVMVEAPTDALARRQAERLVGALHAALGQPPAEPLGQPPGEITGEPLGDA